MIYEPIILCTSLIILYSAYCTLHTPAITLENRLVSSVCMVFYGTSILKHVNQTWESKSYWSIPCFHIHFKNHTAGPMYTTKCANVLSRLRRHVE